MRLVTTLGLLAWAVAPTAGFAVPSCAPLHIKHAHGGLNAAPAVRFSRPHKGLRQSEPAAQRTKLLVSAPPFFCHVGGGSHHKHSLIVEFKEASQNRSPKPRQVARVRRADVLRLCRSRPSAALSLLVAEWRSAWLTTYQPLIGPADVLLLLCCRSVREIDDGPCCGMLDV